MPPAPIRGAHEMRCRPRAFHSSASVTGSWRHVTIGVICGRQLHRVAGGWIRERLEDGQGPGGCGACRAHLPVQRGRDQDEARPACSGAHVSQRNTLRVMTRAKVDGEPCLLAPSTINIGFKNKVRP